MEKSKLGKFLERMAHNLLVEKSGDISDPKAYLAQQLDIADKEEQTMAEQVDQQAVQVEATPVASEPIPKTDAPIVVTPDQISAVPEPPVVTEGASVPPADTPVAIPVETPIIQEKPAETVAEPPIIEEKPAETVAETPIQPIVQEQAVSAVPPAPTEPAVAPVETLPKSGVLTREQQGEALVKYAGNVRELAFAMYLKDQGYAIDSPEDVIFQKVFGGTGQVMFAIR